MNLGLRRAAAAALVVATFGASADDWHYTIRPGDALWNVAAKYCGSPSYAARIAAANGLADQGMIRPGSRLRIPVRWLVRQPVTAEVVAVNGVALLLHPEPRPAEVAQAIEMGQRLRTEEGSAVVGFADGSTLQVSSHAEVLFNVLTAYGDTGMVDTNLRFSRGRSTSRIIRGNQGSRFRISTPSGTAAVRGTEFRVAVATDETLTESLQGQVGFQKDREISLPAGFGVASGPAGMTKEALLTAPVWQSAAGVKSTRGALIWNALAGARGYRISVFRPLQPINPIREIVTLQTQFELAELEPASYLIGVRGIATSGLEGFDANLAVELRPAGPLLTDAVTFTPEAVHLRWQATEAGAYRVQLSERKDFLPSEDRLSTRAELRIRDLRPGRYYWRVRDESSVFSDSDSFLIRPTPVSTVRAEVDAQTVDLSWEPVAGADGYQVDVSGDEQFEQVLINRRVETAAVQVDLDRHGKYFVRIITLENDTASEPTRAAVILKPAMPWWPLPFALLLLIGL